MNARLAAQAALIGDTFLQARNSMVGWLLPALTGTIVLLMLTASFPDEGPPRWCFGELPFPADVPRKQAVPNLLLFLITVGGNGFGVLLMLMLTGAWLPAFLDPTRSALVLAKPITRSEILLGKYLGVVAFAAVHAGLFVVGLWVALGVRTGVWPGGILWGWPLLVVQVAMFHAFSVLLAVSTRNAIATVVGTLLFALVCWGLNLGRSYAVAYPPEQTLAPAFGRTVEYAYWLLPKPVDLGYWLHLLTSTEALPNRPAELTQLLERGAFHPVASLWASLGYALAILGIAAYELEDREY